MIPDYLVTMLRLQLPGLAGFCLGGLALISGLGQGKKWARPGLYIFALLAMGQLVLVNSDANPTVPKSFYHLSASRAGRIQGPARNLSLPIACGRLLQTSDCHRIYNPSSIFNPFPPRRASRKSRKERSGRDSNSSPGPCFTAWREALTSTRSARCLPSLYDFEVIPRTQRSRTPCAPVACSAAPM